MSDNRDHRDDNRSERRSRGPMQGPGRRVYTGARGPRVGGIARDVPRAQRVDGDGDPAEVRERYVPRGHGPAAPDARRERMPGRDAQDRPHHGAAWRSESGPGRRAPEAEGGPSGADDGRVLAGRNPIREALRAGRPVEKLLIAAGDLSGAAREIVRLARDAGVVVQQVDRTRLDQIAPNHQGMLAYVAAVPYAELSDLLDAARAKGEDPFLILLDGVTDPHNLGAIIRSAECAGAHGVVIPERRASGLTPVVAKAAAGALSYLPVARVPNLNRAIDALKEAGVWVLGTAMDGENALEADLTGPVALVIGSEGEGVSRLTLEKCDRTLSLPMLGRIESLNASVAAGILMYEIVRARAK